MKNLFNISLVLALAAVAGCASAPESAPSETSNAKLETQNAKPAAKPAPKPRNASERLRAFVREVNDREKKVGTVEAIAKLEDYRKTNPDCTNLGIRVELDYAILDRCRGDRTPRGAKFDAKAAAETLLKVAPRIYGDPKVEINRKCDAAKRHCLYLCDEGRYDDAIALAKKIVAQKDPKGNESANAYAVLKDVYRLAERYPDAKAAAVRAIELSGGHADPIKSACALAFEFNDVKSVPEFWKMAKGKNADYELILWVCDKRGSLDAVAAWRDEVVAKALPMACDQKMDPGRRVWLASYAGLIDDTPNGAALRGAVRDAIETGKVRSLAWGRCHQLRWCFMDGNWKRFAAVYGDLRGIQELNTPPFRRAHVYSLLALGRLAEAKEVAAKYRAEFKNPVDVMKLDVMLAIGEDRDALPLIAAAKLEPKENIRVIQLAGQWALVLQKNAAAGRYADAYAKLVKPIPQRRQNVTWSAKPMDGESSYRALWPKLEKSYIDVKMCGDLDNLVTDVATGRIAVEKTDKDTKDARVEVTTCCDVKGLHIYMRIIDPNARAVEDGFAGGKGTEMYFAPGDNEPYICFGGAPRKPIDYMFQTSYTWKDHQRLVKDAAGSPYLTVGETWFTDEDYVEHLFFPWDAFYQKLPKAGSEWKFECLMDGYSWGGSQGVHECSSWGRLVFNLKPEEVTAIRRRILLRNAKSWKRGEARDYVTVAPFDKWADAAIGDPDFYNTSLKPLEEELTGYANRVKPDMSDADVNDIYEHAVPRWIGLKHEIDRLRREYLMRKRTSFN